MASVSFRPHSRTNGQGKAVVLVRITHNYTRKYVHLDLKVNSDYWSTKRQRVTSSHVAHTEINSRLADIEKQIQEVISRMEANAAELTAGWLRDEIEKAIKGDGSKDLSGFIEFAERKLKNYKRQGQTGTHKAYTSNIGKFQDFLLDELGHREIPFHRITPALIHDFRSYCYEVRKNKANTVGKALGVLRTFVRKAMKEGHLEQEYPFRHITVDSEEVEKEKLTPREMERIEALDLDPDSLTAEIRRWFLFAYYAGGMRFSDVATLKPNHIRTDENGQRRVYYRMEKTEGLVGVPIIPEAQEILEYYDQTFDPWVFPILKGVDEDASDLVQKKEAQNALANKYLSKYILPKTDIDKHVSFHLSRNAAAWRLYQSIGDLYKVMKILGHSSVTQTEKYLKGFEDDSLDDDFKSAFG